MRIICPNCDAQYEVDDTAIPPEGRDVQCSNCGNAWFQPSPVGTERLTAALYQEPPPNEEPLESLSQGEDEREDPGPAMPPRRTLDDAVLSVLRDEAEREAEARKADAQTLEMQGDLGLPPPVNPAVGRMSRPEREPEPEMTDAERHIARMKGQPVPQPKVTARRELLPDIEEINSSLKPSERPRRAEREEGEAAATKSGFRSGFALMVLLAAVIIALYVLAPKISEQIPGLADTMTAYVTAVDNARAALDGLLRQMTAYLQSMLGNEPV